MVESFKWSCANVCGYHRSRIRRKRRRVWLHNFTLCRRCAGRGSVRVCFALHLNELLSMKYNSGSRVAKETENSRSTSQKK